MHFFLRIRKLRMVTIREIASDTVEAVRGAFIEEERLPPRDTLEIVQDAAVGISVG